MNLHQQRPSPASAVRLVLAGLVAMALAGCRAVGNMFPEFEMQSPAAQSTAGSGMMAGQPPSTLAPMPRRPIMPEMLVACRGHVLVPAIGMTLVPNGGTLPAAGQYLREERLTPPYRLIRPGDRVTTDRNPGRLNVELDRAGLIVDLTCG